MNLAQSRAKRKPPERASSTFRRSLFVAAGMTAGPLQHPAAPF